MQKWEYLTIKQRRGFDIRMTGTKEKEYEPSVELDKLGNEGWELVSVTPQSGSYGGSWTGLTNELIWVFKRPIE